MQNCICVSLVLDMKLKRGRGVCKKKFYQWNWLECMWESAVSSLAMGECPGARVYSSHVWLRCVTPVKAVGTMCG